MSPSLLLQCVACNRLLTEKQYKLPTDYRINLAQFVGVAACCCILFILFKPKIYFAVTKRLFHFPLVDSRALRLRMLTVNNLQLRKINNLCAPSFQPLPTEPHNSFYISPSYTESTSALEWLLMRCTLALYLHLRACIYIIICDFVYCLLFLH